MQSAPVPMTDAPIILWFRRDLRLADNPMLAEAARTGRPLIPVFILDPETEGLGAAPKWRLGLGIARFAETLGSLGSRLVLRRGMARDVLDQLVQETGAQAVWWGRQYDPGAVARDTVVKSSLKSAGLDAKSFAGHLLFEPWTVQTGEGGYYRVYTPFWKAVRGREVSSAEPPPARLPAPEEWPRSDALADWNLGAAMVRGAAVVARHVHVGEDAARNRLARFIDNGIGHYADDRDFPAKDGTSGLSENLAWGEIGPRQIWEAGWRAFEEGARGAEQFLKELVWREFAYHLMHHTPRITTGNWRIEWDEFPWRGESKEAEYWKRGLTGEPIVDAGMRELYITGRMHNRVRMIVASYLTKHMLTHWKVGLDWFADCLVDWDPASNAMGWQWVAGSGPDAAPYFRVFNPATQAEKFDPGSQYRRKFVAELSSVPGELARSYFEAAPRSWKLDPKRPYPEPLVDLAAGRKRALEAYGGRNT